MKNKITLLLPLVLILSACASTQHSEKKIVEEAKQESVVKGSEETQARILEILKQDSSVNDDEHKKIIAIIEKSFTQYQSLELLANQKKTLLIKEYVNQKSDVRKIKSIKNAIKKTYAEKSDLMMECFDNIAKVMKLHPQSAERFFEKANSFWPMRERSI